MAKQKIPDQIANTIDWGDITARLVLYSTKRVWGNVELGKQIAQESLKTLFDPSSAQRWDFENDPSPMGALRSIANGIAVNSLRKNLRRGEVLPPKTNRTEVQNADQESRLIANDFRRKLMDRVFDLAEGNDTVQEIVLLADDGILTASEQAEHLGISKSRVYEARRRFGALLERARRGMDGDGQ